MKKILIVDVPDGEDITSIDIRTFDIESGMTRHPDWKLLTLPTAKDIDEMFPTYDEVPKENVYRAEGANHILSLLQ